MAVMSCLLNKRESTRDYLPVWPTIFRACKQTTNVRDHAFMQSPIKSNRRSTSHWRYPLWSVNQFLFTSHSGWIHVNRHQPASVAQALVGCFMENVRNVGVLLITFLQIAFPASALLSLRTSRNSQRNVLDPSTLMTRSALKKPLRTNPTSPLMYIYFTMKTLVVRIAFVTNGTILTTNCAHSHLATTISRQPDLQTGNAQRAKPLYLPSPLPMPLP